MLLEEVSLNKWIPLNAVIIYTGSLYKKYHYAEGRGAVLKYQNFSMIFVIPLEPGQYNVTLVRAINVFKFAKTYFLRDLKVTRILKKCWVEVR